MNILNASIQHKYDTPENWAGVESTFIPKAGELIIYASSQGTDDEGNSVETPTKLKVGDGSKLLVDLPFINASEKAEELLEELAKVVSQKLDANQGRENVGSYMRIGEDGVLAPDILRVRYGTTEPSELRDGELFVVYTP